MKILIWLLLLISLILFSGCFEKQTKQVELSPEEIQQRQLKVYEEAAADPRQFKADLKENCPHFGSTLLTTAETIQLGTRVFNAGGVSLTKRIYEGTVYKILYTIKDDCMNLSDALQVGLAKAAETDDHHDQAWALRNALDLIMGGPPLRPPGAQMR
jgi:hypothetical protein